MTEYDLKTHQLGLNKREENRHRLDQPKKEAMCPGAVRDAEKQQRTAEAELAARLGSGND